MLSKDDLQAIADTIDARVKTTETLIKAEIKASEERQTKRLEETKEELRAEIVAARAEAKADNLHLRAKIDKVARDHKRLAEDLEKYEGIPNPDKN